jgi:predicted transcriptional regulator
MASTENNQALLRLTAEIIAAHVRNNDVASAELPFVIEQVYLALRHAGQPVAQAERLPVAAEPERAAPAISAKKSVFPDHIICLEDGRKLKTLKRHLRSTYNMTPEQYREKWGLAPDYPMVAPNYAEHRSALAKQAGLGRKSAPTAAVQQAAEPASAAPPPAAPPAAAPIAAPPAAEPPAAEPARERRTNHTAASVFANFTGPREEAEEQPHAPATAEPGERKSSRKPFSKQLARSMRR